MSKFFFFPETGGTRKGGGGLCCLDLALPPTFLLVNFNGRPLIVFQIFLIKVRVYLLNQGTPWLVPSSSKKYISVMHQRLADYRLQPAGGSDSGLFLNQELRRVIYLFTQ